MKEIDYRKSVNPSFNLTPEEVLQDTIDTCLIIAKRGSGSDDEKQKFTELQRGIKAFDFGFLMSGNFRIDDAISSAARIAFLAKKILMKDLSPIAYYEGQELRDWNIDNPDLNYLNRLKKHPDKSSFYYWFRTAQLLRIK